MGTRYMILTFGLILMSMSTACGTDNPVQPESPTYMGAWALKSWDSDTDQRVYQRLAKLEGEVTGFEIAADGALYIRDPGWCGTPPLSYSTREGSWREESDSSLLLTYFSLNREATFRMEILSVDHHEMRCLRTEVE